MRALTTRFAAVAGGVSTGSCGGVGGGGGQIVNVALGAGALGGAATANLLIVNYVCNIAKAVVGSTNVISISDTVVITAGASASAAGANGAAG